MSDISTDGERLLGDWGKRCRDPAQIYSFCNAMERYKAVNDEVKLTGSNLQAPFISIHTRRFPYSTAAAHANQFLQSLNLLLSILRNIFEFCLK